MMSSGLPPIRVVHHWACSGGTISRSLAQLPGSAVERSASAGSPAATPPSVVTNHRCGAAAEPGA